MKKKRKALGSNPLAGKMYNPFDGFHGLGQQLYQVAKKDRPSLTDPGVNEQLYKRWREGGSRIGGQMPWTAEWITTRQSNHAEFPQIYLRTQLNHQEPNG